MDGELLSLKWNNHRSTFFQVIGSLRNKDAYTDATLACDGKFYSVHKFVLSTCSEYFSAIFERTPCKNPFVVLKDIECRDLEFLLDYMYLGAVNVRQAELASLIRAAECLKIKGLAVPDEENTSSTRTKNSSPLRAREDRHREPSPPSKRRCHQSPQIKEEPPDKSPYSSRHSDVSNSSKRRDIVENSPSNNYDDGEPSMDEVQEDVKLEPPDGDNLDDHHHYLPNNELLDVKDQGGGGTDVSKDLQEFLQSTIDKDSSLHMTDYNPADYPGPSGLQDGGGSPWEGDGSFATDSLDNPSGHMLNSRISAATTSSLLAVFQPGNNHLITHSRSGGRTSQVPPQLCKYRCSFCGYATPKKFNLEKHVRTHTKEMPYKCSLCSYCSSDPSNLKSHIKAQH